MLSRFCAACRSKLAFRGLSSVYNPWSMIEEGPLDMNKATTAAYKADKDPRKINLGEGIYKDDNGKPFVLPVIRQAEKILFEMAPHHEYAPMQGIESFNKTCQEFAFGPENPALKEKRVATVQVLSGTGALRIGGEFLHKFVPSSTPVYITKPTWVNHRGVFVESGLDVRDFRWYDYKNNSLDLAGCLEDLAAAPRGSIIVLHACAHNPTGVDPSLEQWKQISDVIKTRKHIVFFDNAYQGYASGDPDRDGEGFRLFVQEGHKCIVGCSFAKNMGLYGERVGALHVVCENAEERVNVESQLKIVIRPLWSNPPLYGARLVDLVLSRPELKKQWFLDVNVMATRIRAMRERLASELSKISSRNWDHIVSQIGMFSFTGLKEAETWEIRRKWHVYMNPTGRISMSGVNTKNVDYLAKAIHDVTK
uniref:Aspartate aminotransferase n=1 Tax=Stygiella incarcerata TaxID=1712417 RepID=A0A192ZIB0_9EUKA|nr:aspartate aminotransferase [Stygiella incarcerata]